MEAELNNLLHEIEVLRAWQLDLDEELARLQAELSEVEVEAATLKVELSELVNLQPCNALPQPA